jgi:hypothetical protein
MIDLSPPILGRAKLELVGHAQDQMKVRDIGLSDILLTLRNPDETDLPTQPGRKRYRRCKHGGGPPVDVVFEEMPDRIRVITVIAKQRRLVDRRPKKG